MEVEDPMMNAKDRFDACVKLAEFWAARADHRRPFEWRVLFSFCAFMMLAIVYVPRDFYAKTYVVFVIAAYIILFLHKNWIASMKDKE